MCTLLTSTNTNIFFIAFDIHEYLDSNFSGSNSVCSSLASTYLAPLTSWLQTYGFKAMITEFGAANGTQCDGYVTNIINYMADNDVYIGWSAWAAGPLWGDNSPCCSNSETWGSLEPGSLASDGTPGMYEGVWVEEIQPLLPTTLQMSGLSNINGPAGAGGGSIASTRTSTSTSITSTKSSTLSTSSTVSTSTVSTKSTSTSTTTSTAPTSSALVPLYGQCNGYPGIFAGPYVCVSPYVCHYYNPYYSQCLTS